MLQNYCEPRAARGDVRPLCDATGTYQAPFTLHTIVETEGGLCDATSSPVNVEIKEQTIEVEEWNSIENDIAFD